MSKSSIIIYLESSPPFLLELIYSCIFSIILIVFIFTVRERAQFIAITSDAKQTQKNLFTTKKIQRPSDSDGEVIYSNDKKLNQTPLKVHYRRGASDDSSLYSITTSATPFTNEWSSNLKESTEELVLFCPSEQIVRPTTEKRLRRGRSHSPIRRMSNNSSTTVPSYRVEQEHPERVDDMTPEEYESYVQSMTSIWNKLFNKPKTLQTPTQSSQQTNNLSPARSTVDDPSVNSEPTGVGSKDWKQRLQKIWTRTDNILKTDSTLAVRGSESEINIRVFTESEIKMVEQPFKESTDSMYSNVQGANDVQDSDVCTMSGDECKKSQFDIIYEEK